MVLKSLSTEKVLFVIMLCLKRIPKTCNPNPRLDLPVGSYSSSPCQQQPKRLLPKHRGAGAGWQQVKRDSARMFSLFHFMLSH